NQVKGVAGGRGIDNDPLEALLDQRIRQCGERRQVLGIHRNGVQQIAEDLSVVQNLVGAALRVEERIGLFLELASKPIEPTPRVQLASIESLGAPDLSLSVGEPALQDLRKRMTRVGRDQQNWTLLLGEGYRRSGGAGALARSAWANKKDQPGRMQRGRGNRRHGGRAHQGRRTFRRRKLQRLGFLSLGPVVSKFLGRLQSAGGDFATREQVNRDVLVQLLKFADMRSLQSSAALASGTALVVLDLVDEDLRHRNLALPQLREVPARLHLGGRLSKR